MAIAIVRDDLLGHAADNVPTMMNYTTLLNKDSMYNTPPCWCIYMTGLVLKYLENDIGGLASMQKINEAKAKVLYDYLGRAGILHEPRGAPLPQHHERDLHQPQPRPGQEVLRRGRRAGFVNLKGHRLVAACALPSTTPCQPRVWTSWWTSWRSSARRTHNRGGSRYVYHQDFERHQRGRG